MAHDEHTSPRAHTAHTHTATLHTQACNSTQQHARTQQHTHLVERRPARAAVELVLAAEQRQPADGVDVRALGLVVPRQPVGGAPRERALGAGAQGDVARHVGEARGGGVARLDGHRRDVKAGLGDACGCVCCWCCCGVVEGMGC